MSSTTQRLYYTDAYRTSFSELKIAYGESPANVLLANTLALSILLFRLRSAR